jgi:hypothetical protein
MSKAVILLYEKQSSQRIRKSPSERQLSLAHWQHSRVVPVHEAMPAAVHHAQEVRAEVRV